MGAEKRETEKTTPATSRSERLSPASQIGRMRSTGGTPESRRPSGATSDDGEDWKAPVEEDRPVDPAGRDADVDGESR
jgi:hypothetical protein